MKYPRLSLRIFNKKGKEIHTYHTGYKQRILSRIRAYYKRGFTIYFRVRHAKGFDNEGEYTTKKDFLKAYRAFTEWDLMKEFTDEKP